MSLEFGNKLTTSEQEILEYFAPDEGSINFYFGRIRSGKNYAATCDILDRLNHGSVEYVNYPINWKGYDQRDSFAHRLVHFLLFRGTFFRFNKGNLRYFSRKDVTPEWLNSLTDCNITIDEGHWVISSYSGTKISDEVKSLLLNTGHMNRTLNIISQRTQMVHVIARANINRFFHCRVKRRWPWLIFAKDEYQDMKGEDVDMEVEPVSTQVYFGRKKIFEAYDTHYLRDGVTPSQYPDIDVFSLGFKQRFALLFTPNALRVQPSLVTGGPEFQAPETVEPEAPLVELPPAIHSPVVGIEGDALMFQRAQDYTEEAFWESWNSQFAGNRGT